VLSRHRLPLHKSVDTRAGGTKTGWHFINERRAISLDSNCGWARGKADVLYVADAFAVMRKVNELLAAKK
jgi:hypothetical protein